MSYMNTTNPQLFQSLVKIGKMVGVFAFVSATLFTMWTPANILVNQNQLVGLPFTDNTMLVVDSDQAASPYQKIGIIVGHHGYAPEGIPDPGAVCPDGLTEVSLNLRIATLLRQDLLQDGFIVELLDEVDPLLEGYEALAVISIHNDTCEFIDNSATGFKVKATYKETNQPELSERLAACVVNRYNTVTGLRYDPRVTDDMTRYHAFEKFAGNTPSVIVETGYMLLDRQLLTEQPDLVAHGLAQGIRCFAYNETINLGQ
ncbi:MAG TPA: N-acetylmuramoyl-L-alanine amidase [Chloroflexi bacterium]|nr:N-acetylmuramoyl-L-alanine amidase [Chloroflexota bacterium]